MRPHTVPSCRWNRRIPDVELQGVLSIAVAVVSKDRLNYELLLIATVNELVQMGS